MKENKIKLSCGKRCVVKYRKWLRGGIRIMKYTFTPRGVCSQKIDFEIDDNQKIHNVVFTGGCHGNLKAIAKLTEGMDASKVKELLAGNTCGFKSTSCADQFAIAIDTALQNK